MLNNTDDVYLSGNNDGDYDDETYNCIEGGSPGLAYSDDEDFVNSEDNGDRNDSSDYDPDTFINDLYDSNLVENEIYLDRAYGGKIYEECKEQKITLERGMLFANVDAFREVLKDYVSQEGFQIVKIRNERSRVTAMCVGKGCEWYLHASTDADDVSFEIKVYEGKHTCAKSS